MQMKAKFQKLSRPRNVSPQNPMKNFKNLSMPKVRISNGLN